MKPTLYLILPALVLTLPVSAQSKKKLPSINDQPAAASAPAAAPVADPGWPRVIEREGARLLYEQPQIDEWKDYRSLRARVAFSLTKKDGTSSVGIAELQGNTAANLDDRTVVIDKVAITALRFPGMPEAQAAAEEAAVRKVFPGRALTVSLDRLLAGVERSREAAKTVELKMDAPAIVTGPAPSSLLIVEGKPVNAPVEGTKLEFIVNTNWDLFFDPEGKKYYLLSDKTWLTSDKLESGWTLATSVPAEMDKLPKEWEHIKKSLPVKVSKGMAVPAVHFSDKPAELIEFEGGAPVFEKVESTRLLWARNTESWLFQHSGDSQFYFLTSGRWFRAPKLEGPWTYAGNDLPEDFKVIPPGHACSDVLVSVPGTREASDAVLLAQIPTQASVKRTEAEAKVATVVKYDGEPAFTPIGNTGISYASNTGYDIIQVEKNYYLCLDAVWFVSSAPVGPWKVCNTVPAVIYSIPPSSPVHRVTYVKVETGNDPDVVVCSYTSGYYGAFIAGAATAAVLMWGTGYYHPPYVYWGVPHRPIYRPYPCTYGVAAVYNPWTGGYAIGQRAYGPYASAGRAAWYNPVTGGYGRVASVQGPYGGRTVASGYNPRTDTAWATRQGSNGFAQWGTTAVRHGDDWVRAGHIATDEGGIARWRGSEGGGRVTWTDDGAKGVAVHDGNLYAGKDGNVYRRDENGDWSKYGGGGEWENVRDPNRPGSPNRPNDPPRVDGPNNPGRPGNDRPNLPNNPDRPNQPNRPGTPERPLPEVKPGPSTLPADGPGIERRPATRPVKTPPAPATMDELNREAVARDRGLVDTSRRENFQRNTRPSTMPANTPSSRPAPGANRPQVSPADASSRTFNPSGTPRAGGGANRPAPATREGRGNGARPKRQG